MSAPLARPSRLLLAPLLVAPLLLTLAAAPGRGEAIEVAATPVVLNLEDRAQTRVGRLRYLGGLKLSSPDSRFGGLSGLTMAADGSLVAVSDRGYWFTAKLVSDRQGVPLALTAAVHRILRYAAGDALAAARPEALAVPEGLRRAPPNGGIEAFAILDAARLLVVTENLRVADDRVAGWLIVEGVAAPLSYVTRHRFKPTDFALLPAGDLLALERRYSPVAGPGARLVRIPGAAIAPGARLEGEELARLVPPVAVDNMEGLALRPAADGGMVVYLLSDDNFNPLQATLLMAFRLEE
jgi:hypothetical protein